MKAAVKGLHLPPAPEKVKVAEVKTKKRQLVKEGIDELLKLIGQKEAYPLLLEKAQVLQWRIKALYGC